MFICLSTAYINKVLMSSIISNDVKISFSMTCNNECNSDLHGS